MASHPKNRAEKATQTKTKPLSVKAARVRNDLLGSRRQKKPDATFTSRDSLLLRVQSALQDIVKMTDENRILEALSTPTGMDALINLVGNTQVASHVASLTDDPLRAARARAVQQRLALIKAEGGCIGVEDVAARLRLTRAAIDKRRKAGRLIGIDGGSRAIEYPSWQFDETETLKGLEAALSALGVSDALMQMQFFLTVEPDLEKRPLDALRAGEIEAVEHAAKRYQRLGDDR
jgi:hypothetical protein